LNLRQKIKQAKKELRELEKTAISNRNYRYFKRKKELSDFINTKRQLNSYTNDEKILKGKITYMELSCGIRKLCIIKHANGKPLSHKQQIHFNNQATKAFAVPTDMGRWVGTEIIRYYNYWKTHKKAFSH